jgi:hypothetical protein
MLNVAIFPKGDLLLVPKGRSSITKFVIVEISGSHRGEPETYSRLEYCAV